MGLLGLLRKWRDGDEAPQFGYGRHGRPLWSERDRDAEAIRKVLRRTGAPEWTDTGVGFVVEGAEPFSVAAPHCDDQAEAVDELRRYTEALTRAGYAAELEDLDAKTTILNVWLPGHPCTAGRRPSQADERPPRRFAELDKSRRELVNEWLRGLTILGETGRTIQQRLDLIRQVNQPATITLPLRVVGLDAAEQARDINAATAAMNALRSQQAGVNLMIEELLMKWLGEATGQTRSQIIERLALTIDGMLPPDE